MGYWLRGCRGISEVAGILQEEVDGQVLLTMAPSFLLAERALFMRWPSAKSYWPHMVTA